MDKKLSNSESVITELETMSRLQKGCKEPFGLRLLYGTGENGNVGQQHLVKEAD